MVKLILPPPEVLASAANALSDGAESKRQNTLTRGLYDLLTSQAPIVRVSGAYLVPSSSRAGIVHRVDDVRGCSCEAGSSGKACRHTVALEIIEAAQQRSMPALTKLRPTYAEAKAAMDELFA